ncbi:cytochrome c [Acidovorax sp. CCYZU-2555]|uniref:cytochrome c n=1 Tax=Acidovorax sp. CCYZU-2555 TaxID=2835042 RepID=UPI001BD04A0C|nr:cytochrome c [Acidovorax sp. CCYZU-2555]MBS7778774.1 c-type cytochrome [Acidovorax sp. CCYZU-2555]
MSLSLHSNAAAPALPAELLHGLALRPPQARWNGLRYQGSELLGADLAAVRAMTGVVAAVQRQHFLGVVAATPVYALQAASSLAPVWQTPGTAMPLAAQAASSEPSSQYVWQMARAPLHDANQVVAWCLDDQASVWLPRCGAQTLRTLRRELAALLQLPETALQLISPAIAEGAAEPQHLLDLLDAAADAALLSQAVARPVSVACQTGSAQAPLVLRVPAPAASPSTELQLPATAASAATLLSDAPWAVRPSLARLLSQPELARASAQASVRDAGEVQARKTFADTQHAGVQDLNAAQVFAQESLWHEQALAQGQDPLAYRMEHLQGRAQDLARQVAERAQWPQAEQDTQATGTDGRLHGRGFATAQLQTLDASGAERMVWSAWVAEVAVHPQTGAIEVTRVVAGHDSQQLHAAQGASLRPEIQWQEQDPQLLANARRLLGTAAAFDDWNSPQPTGLVPRAQSTDLAALPEGSLIARGRLDLDGVETLPAAAAIANAIAHATGVRLREVPFDAEHLRRSLGAPAAGAAPGKRPWGWLAAGAVGVAGMAAMAWPLKPALPLTAGPDVALYSAQALERGRLIAAAGDCVVCHTAPGGAANAGGFGLETPFGTIYSTNITPDNETGIGRWSFAAFERAMRQGIHQDGRQLYPAFPYTAFAKLSDGDMQALYGYLMAQAPVKAQAPQTQLAFPYNLRPAMAGWNALFHDATPFKPDPARTPEWNRGAYLVEGAGHCAACHSPRNALGAEKSGIHYLGGGEAEGWKAPALNQLAEGKRPWTRDTLYQYLRTGFSPQHGVAAGPMAPVIHGLAELPDSDLRAITTYLLELPATGAQPTAQPATQTAAAPLAVATPAAPVYGQHVNGERIYQNACAVCHEAGSGPTLFGVKPLLALNTNLHAATPDNLVQVILHGIQAPANEALGHMPGFKDSLDDAQILDLTRYLRARFAPEEKAWPHDTTAISKLRAAAAAH